MSATYDDDDPAPPGYLTGRLLIATPTIISSCFARSVIYVCSHNEHGAMGVIINLSMPNISDKDIYEQLKIPYSMEAPKLPIHFGGPVETSRGFVLYSGIGEDDESIASHDGITLSCNVGLLKNIATGKGPAQCLLSLGYAGWSPGQIESEMEGNSWIDVPASRHLIFDVDNGDKWALAAQSIGVDMLRYSPSVGHA